MHNHEKVLGTSALRSIWPVLSIVIAGWGCKVSDVTFALGDNDGGSSSGPERDAANANRATDAAIDRSSGSGGGKAAHGVGGGGAAGAGEGPNASGAGGVDAPVPEESATGGASGLEGAGGWQSESGGNAERGLGGFERGGSEAGVGGAAAGKGGSGQGGLGHQGGSAHSGGAGPGQGGSAQVGGSTASGGAGPGLGGAMGAGGATGTGGTEVCPKGATQGTNVAVIGDSFIAMNQALTRDIEALASANGSLPSGQHYDDRSVSGSSLTGGSSSISNQYANAQRSHDILYVIMDGGGNECMSNDASGALAAARTLFSTMSGDGVLKLVYLFYPEPVDTDLNSYSTLRTCYATLRPQLKADCDALTSPKCYFVDLRDSWNGHPEYTSDGIHPTAEGDTASSKQIWDVMKENCVAQ